MSRLATIAAVLGVLFIGVYSLATPGAAQEDAVTDGQDTAQLAFDTWYAGDYERFHGLLSSDVRGEIALQNLGMRKRLTNRLLADEEFSVPLMARLSLLDPEGRLKLTTPERLRELTDSEFIGLASGLLAVSYQLRQRPTDRWALVNYAQGIRAPRQKLKGGYSNSMIMGAYAEFQSVDLKTAQIWLVRVGTSWSVDSFEVSNGRHHVALDAFLKEGASYDVRWPGISPADDRLEAGEDFARLLLQAGLKAYDKNGSSSEAFEKTTEAGKAEAGEEYTLHKVRTGFARDGGGVAVVLSPTTDGDPWILAVGYSSHEKELLSQHSTEEAAETALRRIKR